MLRITALFHIKMLIVGDEPITYIFDKHTTRFMRESLSVPYRIQQVMEVVHVTVQ